MVESRPSIHRRATRDFEREVRQRYGEAVAAVYLYGSVARDDHRRESDVDLLVVTSEGVDRPSVEGELRDLAYDIELDYGVVVSLIVLSETEFERRQDRPFFRTASQDAELLYG